MIPTGPWFLKPLTSIESIMQIWWTKEVRCEFVKHQCWSLGVPDLDCPGQGLCCFNGCVNVCQPSVSPVFQRFIHTLPHIPPNPAYLLPGKEDIYLTYSDILKPPVWSRIPTVSSPSPSPRPETETEPMAMAMAMPMPKPKPVIVFYWFFVT